MNSKQWYYIYTKVKSFFRASSGTIPDGTTADRLMVLYDEITALTEKTRASSEKAHNDIESLLRVMFCIVHSAEQENKPL